MERLAESEGDLATLAAVKQRDLSSAHDFLSLAELYQRAGQPDEAMAWAERGLQRVSPNCPTARVCGISWSPPTTGRTATRKRSR